MERAIVWSLKNRFSEEMILTITFIKEVHHRMFSEVWKRAGKFRNSDMNIGVDKFLIEQELTKLVEDCRYWITHRIYPEDEIAVRFKFRMVSIHPFPKGNGRHSRICGGILISNVFGSPVFPWGGKSLKEGGETRKKYLDALHKADQGDIGPLVEFARSGSLQ
jgi:Fic-DOC domain mobile mystery protein B